MNSWINFSKAINFCFVFLHLIGNPFFKDRAKVKYARLASHIEARAQFIKLVLRYFDSKIRG